MYGSEVIHTATITSEVPVTTLKWQKGTKELDISSSKYTQSGDGPGTVTLTIKHVDFTDSGNYQVEVSNIAGRTNTSNQVSLTVTGGKAIDDYKQQRYHYYFILYTLKINTISTMSFTRPTHFYKETNVPDTVLYR